MRVPARANKYSKRITKLASSNNEDQVKLWRVIEIMESVTAKDCFVSSLNLKKQTMAIAIREGMGDLEADRLYRAASQVVMPFLKGGEKILRTDALIDGMIKEAKDNLYEAVYNDKGEEVGRRFSANNMNAITKAVSLQLQTLTKVQSNLIAAQKEAKGGVDEKDFDISEADKEQLERYVKGELMDNPEIVEMLIAQIEQKDIIEIKNFDESIE